MGHLLWLAKLANLISQSFKLIPAVLDCEQELPKAVTYLLQAVHVHLPLMNDMRVFMNTMNIHE